MIHRRRMTEEERVEARGSDSWGDDISGPAFVGEENKASILTISHELYRAAILQRAKKLCGEGKEPNAKCFSAAQKSVDEDLKKGGVKVVTQGATPGRVTR